MSVDPGLIEGLERPARYLGLEPGAMPNRRPDAAGRLFSVALAFPDVYEIAHGHLGHKILYHMLNSVPGFTAERVYAPWTDYERRLRTTGAPLRSLESSVPVASFDVVGFSLQYEMAYTNILNMLELSGLPLSAADRPEGAPLVVAGGPGASNPEPLAQFFDLFFLGDAEASFMDDLALIKEWRHHGATRAELFRRLSGRPGVYVPSLFRPILKAGRLVGVEPLDPDHPLVVRAVAPTLKGAPFPSCQITPLIKPVHDRIVVEIGRGCSRGCRFCQAGFIYRPVRERDREEILRLADLNLIATGQDEAAFLSLSAGDHTQIERLVTDFMDRHAPDSVALSLPSLRVRTLSGALAAQIRRVRKTGFTLAPEAATARLRAVINKDLTEDDVLAAADTAFSLGWRTLKLYFMVGLPTETDDDLASVATLSGKIAKARRAKLNLGVAHFTPKAHTPFQWHPGSEPALIEKRLGLIKSAARVPGITVKYNDAGVSFVEALLSRGDRRLGPLLAEVHRRGGRFEAWNDHFSLDRWLKAMDDLKLDLKEFLRARETDEVLPWDHLFCGPSKPFLLKELARSEAALTTPDCRWAGCLGCGACHDGATVDLAEPAVAEPGTTTRSERDAKLGQAPVGAGRETAGRRAAAATGRPPLTFRFMGRFSKDGAMALLGHLETAELFKRAFRRAGLKLAMSEGFHPQPKLSFLTALPLGVPSLDERFTFGLERPASPALIMDQMELPEGLKLLDVTALSPESAKPRATAGLWLVRTPDPVFTGPPLHPTAHLRYTDHKSGPRDFALADFVTEVSVLDPHSCRLLVRMGQNGTPKPLAAARLMWDLEPDHPASLFKLATILDRDPS